MRLPVGVEGHVADLARFPRGRDRFEDPAVRPPTSVGDPADPVDGSGQGVGHVAGAEPQADLFERVPRADARDAFEAPAAPVVDRVGVRGVLGDGVEDVGGAALSDRERRVVAVARLRREARRQERGATPLPEVVAWVAGDDAAPADAPDRRARRRDAALTGRAASRRVFPDARPRAAREPRLAGGRAAARGARHARVRLGGAAAVGRRPVGPAVRGRRQVVAHGGGAVEGRVRRRVLDPRRLGAVARGADVVERAVGGRDVEGRVFAWSRVRRRVAARPARCARGGEGDERPAYARPFHPVVPLPD